MYNRRYQERIFAPGELVRHLVQGLVAKGHEVTWFTAPEETTKARVVKGDSKLLDQDLKIRVFQDIASELKEKMSLYGTKMYYEMDLLTRAYQLAEQEHFELMHVFHSFGYLAHFFAEMTKVPTIFTLHDPLPSGDMLENWLMERFPEARYVSLSLSQQRGQEAHFIGNVYNGINAEEFAFDPRGGERFIAVGRMLPVKGFDQAIAAVKKTGCQLTLASWITENVEKSDYYRRFIAPDIDGTNLKVESLLQEKERVALYQKARALLFPISWEEPFGLVMVEAMATGTPVIAYNRGSVAEIVRDGVTGFIVNPDLPNFPDSPDLLIKKRGLEGLVEAIKRIGEIDRAACRKHVEQNFTVEKMVEGYEKVYRKIVSS